VERFPFIRQNRGSFMKYSPQRESVAFVRVELNHTTQLGIFMQRKEVIMCTLSTGQKMIFETA
jgi:hypothetical protein